MMAKSMALRLSSIPVGAPGSVTQSNTLLQAMLLMAANRCMSVSLSSTQNAGDRAGGEHAHDPHQMSQTQTQNLGRIGCSNDARALRPSSPALVFWVNDLCLPQKRWDHQKRQLSMGELPSTANPPVGLSNLSNSWRWLALLAKTVLAALVWPRLPRQPFSLLGRRQMVVDLERSGAVVVLGVSSCLGRLLSVAHFDWDCTVQKTPLCSSMEPGISPSPTSHFLNGNLSRPSKPRHVRR